MTRGVATPAIVSAGAAWRKRSVGENWRRYLDWVGRTPLLERAGTSNDALALTMLLEVSNIPTDSRVDGRPPSRGIFDRGGFWMRNSSMTTFTFSARRLQWISTSSRRKFSGPSIVVKVFCHPFCHAFVFDYTSFAVLRPLYGYTLISIKHTTGLVQFHLYSRSKVVQNLLLADPC